MTDFTPEYAYIQGRYQYWAAKGFTPTTALDIGACKAQWTNVIRSVSPNCQMTLVEADKRCKVALDPLAAHHEIHYTALSSDAGKKPFYLRNGEDVESWGSSSLYLEQTVPFLQDFRQTVVETNTIDNLFAGRHFDLIKLDTQGSELDILEGGKSVWLSARFVQIELSLVKYNKGAPIFHDYIAYMAANNFYTCDFMQAHMWGDGTTLQLDLLFQRELP
jgi:FkbM family methyltransferase